MNWLLQNWYWIALGAALLAYLLVRRRRAEERQAVHEDDYRGLLEAAGDSSKRSRRRHGCCERLRVTLSTPPAARRMRGSSDLAQDRKGLQQPDREHR